MILSEAKHEWSKTGACSTPNVKHPASCCDGMCFLRGSTEVRLSTQSPREPDLPYHIGDRGDVNLSVVVIGEHNVLNSI